MNKLYVWQNRGFFMGRLLAISEYRLGAGFADSSPFSQAFRNRFGITPSSGFGRAANVQIVLA